MKRKKILTGILLIAAAVFLVLSQMHVFNLNLSVWGIIGTVIFATGICHGLIHSKIYETVFSAAFLLMIYAPQLHITKLVPWTILLAALLIAAGLNLLIKPRYRLNFMPTHLKKNSMSDTTFDSNEEEVVINQSFSGTSRYVHSKNLRTISIDANIGDINLYLDDAQTATNEITADINVRMSDVTIYVPRNWLVVSHLETPFSDFSIKGRPEALSEVTVTLEGTVSMSDFTIKYV